MKAFQLTIWEETAVIAAATASKARYAMFRHLRDFGARNSRTGKPWPELTELSVTRFRRFDDWAKQQPATRHVTLKYAEGEQAQLHARRAR